MDAFHLALSLVVLALAFAVGVLWKRINRRG